MHTDTNRPEFCKVIAGVEVHSTPDGSIVWASDWSALYHGAPAERRLVTETVGGPNTLGHSTLTLVR